MRMPADVRKRLDSASEALRDAGVGGEWQEEGTHHLTLKYIGEIGSEKYDAIAEALREPCRGLSLPTFTIGPLFTFEAHDGRTVLAARVTPKDDLERLFRVLERVAVENGAEKSKFPSFRPHVTLCYLDGKEDWKRAKAEVDLPDEFGELTIATVPLNESKGSGDDFKIKRTVRIGCGRAFHTVWAAITVFPDAKATEVTCPHCEWNPVGKRSDGSFRCPTCGMQFWPSGEGPKKKEKKPPKEGLHQCTECGQGIAAYAATETQDGEVYCAGCYAAEFAQCSKCEEEVRKGADGSVEIDGDWFCDGCPAVCENCREEFHPDKAQECDNETHCPDCYEDFCVSCEECGNTLLKNDATDAFDTWFCGNHTPKSCDSCGEYLMEDDMYGAAGGVYCEMCHSDIREQMTRQAWADFYDSYPKLEDIDALQKAVDEDEEGMTPDIYVKIFADMDWDDLYGGDVWAHIAETWRDLARAKESEDWAKMLALTDHAFDLVHNTGSLFTKAKEGVKKWLFKALEEKYFRDPLEYRDKLSADVRKLLDAHIRSSGGVRKWKERMEGRDTAMRRVEKSIAEQDSKMAKRVWDAFDLSVPLFRGRDSFLDVAFWSASDTTPYFTASDIRKFMHTGDPEMLVKIMMQLPSSICEPVSSHPAATYLREEFVPKAIEVVEKTPGLLQEKMKKVQKYYRDRVADWEKLIRSTKVRRKDDAKEEALAAAVATAFLKVALDRTDFYDFYALTVVDCARLPDDMVRLCNGLKKVTLIQVADAIIAILRRAVVREARHAEFNVGWED